MAATQRVTPRRCAVLGSPISHSLSPVLHRAGYARAGLDWSFTAHEVDAAGLAGFVAALRAQEWRGLALTMPLKQAVLPLLDDASPTVAATGAANTLLLEPDGRRRGDNTDVSGITAALVEAGIGRVEEAVVLGGGATARSALAALAGTAERVVAYVRTPARAGELAAVAAAYGLALRIAPWSDARSGLGAPLVLATTPPGALDQLAAGLPGAPGVLLDVGYDPWPTALGAAWSGAGGAVVGGLDVLAHQAAEQFRAMTGVPVPVAVLRSAGVAVLARRGAA